MPTINGTRISDLVAHLNHRGVLLFHACQLKDFEAYLALGGVASRNLMTESGLEHTPFDTDAVDRTNDVWDKVFLNLEDFGFPFAYGARNENTAPTPNPYGPILLGMEPESLLATSDVAVCLRSAGAQDFSRENEALGTIEEVDRVFTLSLEDCAGEYDGRKVKFKSSLRDEFPDHHTGSPEISCAVEGELIPFKYLTQIVVDPYVVGGNSLVERVRTLSTQSGLGVRPWARRYTDDERRGLLQDLADFLAENDDSLEDIVGNENGSPALKDYATRLVKGNMDFAFGRFATYLQVGTIEPLR